jgi:tRNA modification GTPase
VAAAQEMTKAATIVALATAAGRSGIGVIRVSGPDAVALARAIVRDPLPPRRAVLSDFVGAQGETIDRGIALFFPAPRSYTGEDVLELQGHGGAVVMQLLLDRCLQLGARIAAPGEFTQRAYLNEKLDLAQAEAVADLIDAGTVQAARSAMRSLQGEFSRRVSDMSKQLVELRALVEAALDFPDEDLEALPRSDVASRLTRLREDLMGVLAVSRQGNLLREGLHVVLAGRPNVGKSSLLNQLAGEDLAIVTDVPGTTRDAIRLRVDIDGVPVHFIDTAGLRNSEDRVEQAGMARTWATIERADVIVLVIDSVSGMSPKDLAIVERLPREIPCIRVLNKIDLTGEAPEVLNKGGDLSVRLSALTGLGLKLLRQTLLEAAGWQGASEGMFMARARHITALEGAHARLDQASGLENDLELLAEELRLAHAILESVTGRYTPDDLLGEIFSRFCIGK